MVGKLPFSDHYKVRDQIATIIIMTFSIENIKTMITGEFFR